MDLKDHIRAIPDFPKPGILFYDISTLLAHGDAWQVAMGRMANVVRGYHPHVIAGIESRGFLVAAPLALKLGCGQRGEKMILQRAVRLGHGSDCPATRMKVMFVTEHRSDCRSRHRTACRCCDVPV